MAHKIVRSAFALLCLLALVVPPAAIIACGPFFPAPVFVERNHPDLPLDTYAAGTLGVIQADYSPSYLAVAYRYLAGQPLASAEQQQAVDLWNHYLNPEDESQQDAQEDNNSTFKPRNPEGFKRVNPASYQSFGNCLDDAYRTAEKTLADRSTQFGAASIAVKSWTDAQNMVFENCDGVDPGNLVIPSAADASLPPIIQKDREYQIAAAYFYAGKWDEAKKRFQAIAADSTSSWNATAALVAARCDIRAATLGSDDPVERQMRYAAADDQLKKIIAAPALSSMKSGAEGLLGFVEFRLDPYGRMLELSNLIERRAAPETLGANLDDYSQLFRRAFDPAKMASVRQNSDLTDWIASFNGRDKEDRRIARWQESKSVPWLVAVLAWAGQDTPQLADLLDAASKVPANSPAYLTVRYHRDRLLAITAKEAQARFEIDALKRLPPGVMTPSAQNLFLALRTKVAANLDEFVQFAPRNVVRFDDPFTVSGNTSDVEFDGDAAAQLTQSFPTSLLEQAARNPKLPADLRLKVSQAAWTRAILLNEGNTARQIAPLLFNKDYVEASSDPARNFAGTFLILHHPELRPYIIAGAGRQSADGQLDNYRDNWWCAAPPSQPNRPVSPPQFLSEKDRQQAENEWARLTQLDPGTSWLAEQVLTYAKAHPQDARVPEALHLVVVAAHLGCGNADAGQDAKAAFTLLHRRYPKSSWATQTPYWYN